MRAGEQRRVEESKRKNVTGKRRAAIGRRGGVRISPSRQLQLHSDGDENDLSDPSTPRFSTIYAGFFCTTALRPLLARELPPAESVMSFARQPRCLFCSFSRAASSAGPRVPRRQFHGSSIRLSEEGPEDPNSPDDKQPPVSRNQPKVLGDIERDMKPGNFKPLTKEQRAKLAEVYSPHQMASVKAGEKSIDRKDLAKQFAFRRDPMKLNYLDDFSVIEPGVDHHVRAPITNTDYKARFKNEEDFAEDFARFFREMPEQGSVGDWVRFIETLRVTHGKPEGELNPHSSLVPDLFGPGESLSGEQKHQREIKQAEEKGKEAEEMTDALKKLIKDTGLSLNEIKMLRTKALVSHAVVNQTRLGKVRRQYCLSIAGNGDGLLGIGEAKSEEGGDAVLQSKYRAIRNMQPIPRYENRTIFGDVAGKVGAVELKLMNRAPGMLSLPPTHRFSLQY